MKTTVKHFNELTPEELYGILQLRERVFTFEQRCSEPDLDGFDKVAYHIFLTDENGTEACLRMLPKGVLHDEVSFGRIVAAKRRQGLGAAVVKAALQAAKDVFDADTVARRRTPVNFMKSWDLSQKAMSTKKRELNI